MLRSPHLRCDLSGLSVNVGGKSYYIKGERFGSYIPISLFFEHITANVEAHIFIADKLGLCYRMILVLR